VLNYLPYKDDVLGNASSEYDPETEVIYKSAFVERELHTVTYPEIKQRDLYPVISCAKCLPHPLSAVQAPEILSQHRLRGDSRAFRLSVLLQREHATAPLFFIVR